MQAVSSVYLGNIRLDIDPISYGILNTSRRGSVHRLIDGSTIYQDRGTYATDNVIQISGQLFNLTTLQALDALYRENPGNSFTLTDWLGNEVEVIFTPGNESFTYTPIKGSSLGWDYNIQLSVVSKTNWLGLPFTGS